MLHVHRSERADGLIVMLAELVADPLDDAMAAEVVGVPTRGVERWLTQQLSAHLGVTPGRSDGVCANIDFPFPATLVGAALAAAGGVDPKADPWAPERSVWPLLEVVDASLEQNWLGPLAAHLRNSAPEGDSRRFASIRHIADLYDRYSVHRPEMLRSWAINDDAVTEAGIDAGWQAALWRRLRDRIGTPSPAERLTDCCARLEAEPALLDLPLRVSLFGLTRLPASYLDVLRAVAAGRDVHLFLLHPSPQLWDRVAARLDGSTRGLRRADDPTTDEARHPLLASWGRDAREMQLVLAASGHGAVDHHLSVDDLPVDDRLAGAGAGTSPDLLHRLQADVRADRRPPGIPLAGAPDRRAGLEDSDRSISVHACHGRARQVEVLRDAVLHLLEDDPTLEPRDVIVMCPDIETFAPLIQAAFAGRDDEEEVPGPRPDLRVRLADRSLRQTNPVLGVMAELLDLTTARLTATQVLDLAGREPLRRRFHLDDDDLTRMQEWVASSGVRWGLDAAHRAPFQLDGLDANTWRAGLDRTLLGVAMADERQRHFGGVRPLDDVDSGDIDLVGRLAELLDRLDAALSALSETRTLEAWAASLGEIADAVTATSDRDSWQRMQFQHLVDDLASEATRDGAMSAALLGPDDIRALLTDRLRGQPTSTNFRTGHLTVCTLVPMRSVPHRVVCLLGLDDGMFPRHTERDGDDLIAADPHAGDREARSEDRQLLLDALLAAKDRLVITYTGRDERTNLVRPPAVPLGELLDVIERTVRPKDGTARDQLVIRHPLQPFDVRNFTPGALAPTGSWSFDAVNLAGARASLGERLSPPPFLPGPLPDLDTGVVELEQLERFVRHPTRAFLRAGLGLSVADWSHDLDDALPIELDGLEQWAVAERLLAARLAGARPEDCLAAERAGGLLPPGALATPTLARIMTIVEELVTVGATDVDPTSLDVYVPLAGDTTLTGTVAGLRGDALYTVTYSRVSPAHRLLSWIRLLALSAAWPARSFEAVTIGRTREGGANRAKLTIARIGPLDTAPEARQAWARQHLESLVDLFRRGMREPLPLYCRTSAAWAASARQGQPAERAAGKEWTSAYKWDREDRDPEHLLVLGGELDFDRLLAHAGLRRGDEDGAGWEPSEPSRLGRYARRLWDGLLDHEDLVDR